MNAPANSPRDPAERFARAIVKTAREGTLRKLTASLPLSDQPKKQTAHLTTLRGVSKLTVEETLADGKVAHKHYDLSDIAAYAGFLTTFYGRVNLMTSLGDAELMRSKKGTVTARGLTPLERAAEIGDEVFSLPFEREVRHIFDGTAPFLRALGISDKNGRVYDKKQAKFRQINRFLELASDVADKLPKTGTLVVYDLCCGKSYLSFALYAYLHDLLGREVDMLCMDLKADVMDFCADTARTLGFSGMTFRTGDIRTLPRDRHPDLVVSLHACDIATDIVLQTAAELGARVILSTPCCHRYLHKKINNPELSFVVDHPHLRTRIAETLTDALRLEWLESVGYRVEAAELTDLTDTPKNTLLRAVRDERFDPASPEAEKARERYAHTLRFLLGDGAEQYLKDI